MSGPRPTAVERVYGGDRSHYERFTMYHDSFYRSVEAASLTPFSGPALDRGLAGTLVAMTRLGSEPLTPSEGAMRWPDHRDAAEQAVQQVAERGALQSGTSCCCLTLNIR